MLHKLLLLFNLMVALCAQEDIMIYNDNKPIDNKSYHLSIITNMVESEVLKTTNFKMTGKDRDQPSITVRWNHKATITVYDNSKSKEIEISKIELRDYGPGKNDLGDIMLFCIDINGVRYNCEKYSPEFSDSVHSILRYKIIK